MFSSREFLIVLHNWIDTINLTGIINDHHINKEQETLKHEQH